MTMLETGFTRADVTDNAVIRYIERGHDIDIASARERISTLCSNGARYGAHAVAVEDVKFILVKGRVITTVGRQEFVFPPAHSDTTITDLVKAALRDAKMRALRLKRERRSA